jgi:hypothetical protein
MKKIVIYTDNSIKLIEIKKVKKIAAIKTHCNVNILLSRIALAYENRKLAEVKK